MQQLVDAGGGSIDFIHGKLIVVSALSKPARSCCGLQYGDSMWSVCICKLPHFFHHSIGRIEFVEGSVHRGTFLSQAAGSLIGPQFLQVGGGYLGVLLLEDFQALLPDASGLRFCVFLIFDLLFFR